MLADARKLKGDIAEAYTDGSKRVILMTPNQTFFDLN
jgi:hypothetical protein